VLRAGQTDLCTLCLSPLCLCLQADLKVNPAVWGKLSEEARNLMTALLNKNPKYVCAWLCEGCVYCCGLHDLTLSLSTGIASRPGTR
jgi:hypothetical protein